ncbi:MAG TPA: hypothetical protein VMU84_13385 [Thermoanaerobaculia bacterium]|nr:hypothetical protein [Thermoanaerobaculia bacterium]
MSTTLQPIPWPHGLAPAAHPFSHTPSVDAPLPEADYLVVTWVTAEVEALANVMTPGHSYTAWYRYEHNWSSFKSQLEKGAPALEEGCLGTYMPAQIGNKKVLCFKSNLHLNTDGPKLPLAGLWKQIIAEVKPKLVITTGTAGAIGTPMKLGDVLVSTSASFDCKTTAFKHLNGESFHSPHVVATKEFPYATEKLLPINAKKLPSADQNPQIVWHDTSSFKQKINVVTADYFAFDTSENADHLAGLGSAVETDDAVLGMVAKELGAKAPAWMSIRNISDPEITNDTSSVSTQKNEAGKIYSEYAYWTTVGSAITTWAVIASE